MMREYSQKVGAIWLKGVDARRYAWVRVVFGAVVLLNIIYLWPYRVGLFSASGVVDEGVAIAKNPGFYFSVFTWFSSPTGVSAILIAGAAATVLFVIGIGVRVMALLIFVFLISVVHRAPISLGGWEFVLLNFAFVLLFGPLAGNWGIARLWKQRRLPCGGDGMDLLPRYGLVLLQVQVAIIYWQAVFERWDDPFWRDGEFLTYFMLSHHGRFAGSGVLAWHDGLDLLTHLTTLLELALPFLLWIPKTRFVGVCFGVAFHVGIAIVSVNIALFSVTMIMTYVAFLGGRGKVGEPSGQR